ncbi:MAG: hypothetical protein OXG58_02530 [Gemmatimonadetes bacterium]|nr:hypothetical protein [Gemmatimonadota bacterium]MCY3942821.1 hypothetical protein [Gemmatimonadota bacterium]
MPDERSAGIRGRRHRERRILGVALLVSLVFHLSVFVLGGRREIPTLSAEASARKAELLVARGGVEAIRVSQPPPVPLVPPALPVPTALDIEPIELAQELDFDLAALLGDLGPPGPPGLDPGDHGAGGSGDSDIVGPRTRGLIIPPDHKALQGVTLDVWVFVDAAGGVVADSTRLDPPTRDRKLNRQLISEASEWRFHPAIRAGVPLAAWYRYTVSQ